MKWLDKQSSILDYGKPGLDEAVWDPTSDFKLYPEHKIQILKRLYDYLEANKYTHHNEWILTGRIVGSLTSWRYSSWTDIDCHFIISYGKFGEVELNGTHDTETIQESLNEIQKSLNRHNVPTLGNTRHPIEYYFENRDDLTEAELKRLKLIAAKAVVKDGEYNFDPKDFTVKNDKWTVPARKIDVDYDYEEIYKNLIPVVEETMEEFDISLGKIDRKITQVEYLDDSLKAFSNDQKKLFKEKIEKKLDEIEAEIHNLIKTGEAAHEKNKEEFLADDFEEGGIGNLTFKCLQKYGYYYILVKLKELLGEDKEVTMENVDEVKDIVETRRESKMEWLNIKAGGLNQKTIDSVDITDLETKVMGIVGTEVKFKKSLSNKGNLELESQDLVNKAGVMSPVFKTLKIETFNTEYSAKEDVIWITLDFRFELKNGGSNGVHLLTAWYNFDTNDWTFREE